MEVPDLVLIHPPADFAAYRNGIDRRAFGATTGGPTYELYPVGFVTLATRLERAGFRVRIVNLAGLLAEDPSLDVPAYLSRVEARVIGVGLHWMVHAPGAIELLGMLRMAKPGLPLVVGGITASIFHRELFDLSPVDYVIRGDDTTDTVARLLRRLVGGSSGAPENDIPGLTFRRAGSIVSTDPPAPQPEDDGPVDHAIVARNARRWGDPVGSVPSARRPSDPCGVILHRGCPMRCAACGGSNFATGRRHLTVRTPRALLEEVRSIPDLDDGGLTTYGELRFIDWEPFLRGLATIRPKLFVCELLRPLDGPADALFAREIAASASEVAVQLSPETHDEGVRARFGKSYPNGAVERTIDLALSSGIRWVTLFFAAGLPGQTADSVRESLDWAAELVDRWSSPHPRVLVTFAALEPYVDPLSPGDRDPAALGYRIFRRGLAEHVEAARTAACAADLMAYETETMSRAEIARAGVEGAARARRILARF